MKMLLVGNTGGTHIGVSLHRAAESLGHDVHYMDVASAQGSSRILRAWSWRFRDRRPPRIADFNAGVLHVCEEWHPHVLLTTGHAPLLADTLRRCRQTGARLLNYTTDDPWNRKMRASWFLDALPHYDVVFSTRRSNLSDLERLGCPEVTYLPFGYDPWLSFAEPLDADTRANLTCDVLFVGGADPDRVPTIEAVVNAGHHVATYGGYWDRYPSLRRHARGVVGADVIRRATLSARVVLCLVRRANRDGHVMRSLEIAATGACMAVEDTPEHRELFGADGDCVRYFDGVQALVQLVAELLASDDERARLATAVRRRVTASAHTYQDRLRAMLLRAAAA